MDPAHPEQQDQIICTDAMFDIETLGQRPGCIVLSVGILRFDRNHDVIVGQSTTVADIADPRYSKRVTLSMTRQMLLGLVAEKNTLEWYYGSKSKGKLSEIEAAGASTTELRISLQEINDFFIETQNLAGKDCCVWANSPNFDCEIIKVLYDLNNQVGLEFPFDFRHWMDVRTIRDSYKMFFGRTPDGNQEMKHNPLYDCAWQVDVCQLFWSKIRQALLVKATSEVK